MSRWCTSRKRSFGNAFSGIRYNILKESNFKIHIVIALVVIVVGILFSIRTNEWLIIILTIGSVLSAEAMNTAIEQLCDRFLPDKDPKIKTIKDSAAAAVLLISMAAIIIGLAIFLPYLRTFLIDNLHLNQG